MTQTDDRANTGEVADPHAQAMASRRPALPAFVFEIDPDIELRIDRTIQQYGVSEKIARELLRDWCQRGPFARRDIPFDSVPLRVVSSAVLRLEQLLHAERRTLGSTTEPYQGQVEVVKADLEDVWETQRFGKFKKGSMQWERRGSVEIITCYKCGGTGKLPCARCKGGGKVPEACRACRGTGHVSGETTCASCEGTGKSPIPCKRCRGIGSTKCANCQGSGRLRTYQTISTSATVHRRSLVIGAPPGFDKAWIKTATTEETEWFEGETDVLGDFAGRPLPTDTRARVAQYGIDVVPVSWATFFVGKELKVYFVGTQYELRRIGPLLDKKKIVLNISVLVPILLGLLFVARLLFLS